MDKDLSNIGIDEVQSEIENLISETSSPIENLIQKCKVDLSKELEPPPIAMKILSGGKPITLFSKGNFSIVTGKAKSRKSFLVSMLMATAIKGAFEEHFFCPTKGMNILFDTEQSEYKVQQVSRRICKLANVHNPENFNSYHLRTLDPIHRLELIENVLNETPNLNFVAIDGIIDLEIDPILQADQAQKIITKLMQWTDNFKIHIVCVLHYNKTVSTLLGHLGSFAHRKADAVIEVEKDTDTENTSFVKAVDCREMEFEPFAFEIDENGIPRIANGITFSKKLKPPKPERQPRKTIVPNEIEDSVHEEILNEVFRTQKELTYNDFWRAIKLSVKSILDENIGDNKAKDFKLFYEQSNMISQVEIKKKTHYTLKGQKELDLA
jgi:hypothetical protein